MKSLVRSLFVLVAVSAAAFAVRADVDPKAVEFIRPDQVKWVKSPAGTSESAVLFGDPSKPGPYVMRLKWLPGNMSRPHTHATDRFFVVISGTWWVGSGTKFDPDSTVPMAPGSYVIHHAGQPHYDGAKDGETVIQVFGIGPLTTESAEQKP
jgi:quercetin dioxygenase-like cupin family protein